MTKNKICLALLDTKTLLKLKYVCKQWMKLSAQIFLESVLSQAIGEEAIMMKVITKCYIAQDNKVIQYIFIYGSKYGG